MIELVFLSALGNLEVFSYLGLLGIEVDSWIVGSVTGFDSLGVSGLRE